MEFSQIKMLKAKLSIGRRDVHMSSASEDEVQDEDLMIQTTKVVNSNQNVTLVQKMIKETQ